ncbi:hypothetical protein CHUAL_008412 [Chamberlinius hualienensis]
MQQPTVSKKFINLDKFMALSAMDVVREVELQHLTTNKAKSKDATAFPLSTTNFNHQANNFHHPFAPANEDDEITNDVFSFVSGHWLKSSSLPEIPFHLSRSDDSCEDVSTINQLEEESNGFSVQRELHSMFVRLSKRAQRVKSQIIRPVSPSSDSALDNNIAMSNLSWTSLDCGSDEDDEFEVEKSNTIDPQSKWSVVWLSFVSLCYVYNAWSIVLRASFPYQTPSNVHCWLILDYTADLIYLIDLLAFKPHLRVIHDGLWITQASETRKLYLKSRIYWMDLISLLPLDFLYLYFGIDSLLRLPRLLKIETFWEFFIQFDLIASSPFIVRIMKTLIYMLYLIHINACAYYAYSDYEGIGRPDNMWIYNGEGNAYIRCVFFSTKIATSIGKNPTPTHEGEWLFMIASWLSGIFVFAILIGQIRDILSVATAGEEEYRRVIDRTLTYTERLNLPQYLNTRVRRWFAYNKQQHRTLDENRVLRSLPLKLEMDLAMAVHSEILNRVQLFQGFDRNLLRELMLKLQPYLYLPGDFVCRKGDVGQEMYIVNYGQLLVMKDKMEVVKTLNKGCVFGELSLVSPVGGGNRCTANVRSKGFSNVFILTKTDLRDTIRHYSDSQQLLNQRAQRIIRSALKLNKSDDNDDEESVQPLTSSNRSTTPKLLHAVLEVYIY